MRTRRLGSSGVEVPVVGVGCNQFGRKLDLDGTRATSRSAVLPQPRVASVIAGATKPEQVRSNAAAGDWEPSTADLAELNEIAPAA
jgi:aryl-alcohol dehydrogenase-like predicted oxidoreductase